MDILSIVFIGVPIFSLFPKKTVFPSPRRPPGMNLNEEIMIFRLKTWDFDEKMCFMAKPQKSIDKIILYVLFLLIF